MSAEEQVVSFEFDDPCARLATREAWTAELRRQLTWPWIGAVVLGLALFAWSAATPTSPGWWIAVTGLVPALLAVAAVLWVAMLWWLPRKAVAKVSHLPHRRVDVSFGTTLVVRTATETLMVDWSEVVEIRELPSFLVVRLRGGAEIPLPRAVVDREAAAELRRLAGRNRA